MFFGIIKMSLQALRENMSRSILTALGVIVGTAIVIIVLTVGSGVRELILRQLSSITPESLWIEVQIPSEGTRREKDRNTGQGIATGIRITTLKSSDTEDLLRLSNVEGGYSVSFGQSKFTYRSEEKQTNFWAVDPEYFGIENINVAEGRLFTKKEEESLAQVVVIGQDVRESLFGDSDAIGQKIKINRQNYKVVGVAEKIGLKYFMNMDEYAYLPLKTAQKKIFGYDYLNAISLRMHDKNLINTTISQTERIMRRNHDISDPAKDDFIVRTMDEAMEIIDTVTGAISLLLFGIALISMVVGGVGIMNVMYVAVTERTNEIGLKKAIGASPFAIRLQFLIEAVIICMIGGVIGTALGTILSWLVSYVARLFEFDWPFVLSVPSLLLAFQISAVLGIVFGFAPANKAANLNPIDALRSS